MIPRKNLSKIYNVNLIIPQVHLIYSIANTTNDESMEADNNQDEFNLAEYDDDGNLSC